MINISGGAIEAPPLLFWQGPAPAPGEPASSKTLLADT